MAQHYAYGAADVRTSSGVRSDRLLEHAIDTEVRLDVHMKRVGKSTALCWVLDEVAKGARERFDARFHDGAGLLIGHDLCVAGDVRDDAG